MKLKTKPKQADTADGKADTAEAKADTVAAAEAAVRVAQAEKEASGLLASLALPYNFNS